jgi:2-polyprenyl-6-methoxyphenol hydroxylase-like FAD-dependent oxidoreductase
VVVSPPGEPSPETAVSPPPPESASSDITIAGGGIVGLVLALALKKHLNIIVDIYEQAEAFHDDVGAGMGMYPNGLRVIRDVSPNLLQKIQEAGYAYQYRRWMVRIVRGGTFTSVDFRRLSPIHSFCHCRCLCLPPKAS